MPASCGGLGLESSSIIGLVGTWYYLGLWRTLFVIFLLPAIRLLSVQNCQCSVA
ncbi:Hypothetical predicted protein [Olea europaea subsp. europaea]|uniref:Uncharacterized protein n=1 Tax=Olea europaea subsp. europaea TaxID=158383 RepID=A0A8S0SAE9_OLEEU|nr:Hypothetical predicted protein [Olea europaea subsp. europaea]